MQGHVGKLIATLVCVAAVSLGCQRGGGTVAVLGRRDAAPAIARVAEAYERQTGYRPHIFAGSSPGVAALGSQSIVV